jgi:hypothetical protein
VKTSAWIALLLVASGAASCERSAASEAGASAISSTTIQLGGRRVLRHEAKDQQTVDVLKPVVCKAASTILGTSPQTCEESFTLSALEVTVLEPYGRDDEAEQPSSVIVGATLLVAVGADDEEQSPGRDDRMWELELTGHDVPGTTGFAWDASVPHTLSRSKTNAWNEALESLRSAIEEGTVGAWSQRPIQPVTPDGIDPEVSRRIFEDASATAPDFRPTRYDEQQELDVPLGAATVAGTTFRVMSARGDAVGYVVPVQTQTHQDEGATLVQKGALLFYNLAGHYVGFAPWWTSLPI